MTKAETSVFAERYSPMPTPQVTSSPAVNGEGLRPSSSRAEPDDGGASYKGSLASREVSGLKGHKRRLSGFRTRRVVSCGGVTTAPIL